VKSVRFSEASISIANIRIDIAHTDESLINKIARGYFSSPDNKSVAEFCIYLIQSKELGALRNSTLLSKLVGFFGFTNVYYDFSCGSLVVEMTDLQTFFVIYDLDDSFTLEPLFFRMPLNRIANSRGLVPIHASCLLIDGQGILAVGKSGSGKSSIISEALSAGIEVLGDDIVWAGIVNGSATIYATSKSIKLLNAQPSFVTMANALPYTNEKGKKIYYLKSQFEHLFIAEAVATHGFTLTFSPRSRIEPSSNLHFLQNFLPNTITMFSDPRMTIDLCKSLANHLSLQSLFLERRNEVNLQTLTAFIGAQ